MVKSVTATDFEKEVINSAKPVLVDFYASWCGPCKMLAPVIDEISDELGTKLEFTKINIDTDPNVAEFFGVMSVPTLILFRDGVERKRMVGVQRKDVIADAIMENIYD